MKPKAKILAALSGLLLLFLLPLLPLYAQQDAPEDDEDGSSTPYAYLYMQVDRSGGMHFNLTSSAKISQNPELEPFFTNVWGCKLDPQETPAILDRLSPERRKAREEAWRESATHSMSGTCQTLLHRHGFTVQGALDFQPLLNLLKQDQDGIQKLHVTITFANVLRSGALSTPAFPSASEGILTYELPLSTPARPIPVSFGYSRSDLIRLSFLTALFVLVPVVIVLVMRAAALRRGSSDPAGAWFSFMKTLGYCVNGTFLWWGVTHLNTRDQLSDLCAFAGWTDGWRHVLSQVLIFTLPTWTACLLCTALSYKVFVRIRNVSLTWSKFMSRQVTLMGRLFFPLTLYFAAAMTMFKNVRAGLALIGLAWVSQLVCTLLYQKTGKSQPSAITSGPLRDRIFALAQQMGVKVQQVFVIPAAESGTANAFATTKQTVIFTDYLIEKLNQREVDAIAAHELTHLRHNHARMLTFMVVGIMFLPGWILGFLVGLVQGVLLFAPVSANVRLHVARVLLSDWTNAAFMLLCFWIMYSVQKRFEYTADAGAIHFTRDPEAMITGLVKISHLNLMPLQWSRRAEAMLTHPSTLRRLERIARLSNVPEAHLQQLIAQAGQPANSVPAASSYVVTASTPGVVAVGKSAGRSQRNLLFLMALHMLPPAAVAFCLHRFLPSVPFYGWPALAGAAASLALYHLGQAWISKSNNQHMIKSVRNNLGGRTAPFRLEEGVPVGFAPSPCPRFFTTGYNWDHGLLFLSSNKLVFIGSHTSLGLRRDQIRTALLGSGAPSWNNWQRVYFGWEDKATGRSGTFNLLPLPGRGLFGVDSQNLYLRVRAWRNLRESSTQTDDSNLPGLPGFGAVTSMSPREVNKFSRTFGITIIMLALAAGLSSFIAPGSVWYITGTIMLIRIFESIPYWRYRERLLVFEASNAPVVTRPESRLAPPPPPPPPPPTQAAPPNQPELNQLAKTTTS